MSGFTPLNSGEKNNRLSSFQPLSNFVPEVIDGENSDADQASEKSAVTKDPQPKSRNQKSQTIIDRNITAESSTPKRQGANKAIQTSTSCQHQPKVTLHKEDGESGQITGVQIVCGCGEVIDLTFHYNEQKDNPVSLGNEITEPPATIQESDPPHADEASDNSDA